MTTNESLKHWLDVFSIKLGEDNVSAKAINHDQVWQHKSWQEIKYRYEVIPQLQWKPHANKLANDSPQHPATAAVEAGKRKTRTAP